MVGSNTLNSLEGDDLKHAKKIIPTISSIFNLKIKRNSNFIFGKFILEFEKYAYRFFNEIFQVVLCRVWSKFKIGIFTIILDILNLKIENQMKFPLQRSDQR